MRGVFRSGLTIVVDLPASYRKRVGNKHEDLIPHGRCLICDIAADVTVLYPWSTKPFEGKPDVRGTFSCVDHVAETVRMQRMYRKAREALRRGAPGE